MARRASDILLMEREQLLDLEPTDFSKVALGAKEIIHIANVLGFFWQYDYEAADLGRVGNHALLKSELHSDGFLAMKMLLEIENIRKLMAYQLALVFRNSVIPRPNRLVGVPDAATKLAEDLASILGLATVSAKKAEGRITITDKIEDYEPLLPVEDICTKGTGFTEMAVAIHSANPTAEIIHHELVIVNRGGLKFISIGVCNFRINPVAEYPMLEWSKEKCPLCAKGSVAIKPKASEANWLDITTSQL